MWKHQFEFAGFYAAIEQGYYRQHGLEVELREYDQGTDILDEVRSGRATYGIANSSLLAWRLGGQPVVVLANYFRKAPLVLLAQHDLHALDDLRGKRLMVATSDLQSPLLKAALREAGLIPGGNLTILPHSFDVAPFIRGDVDAMAAFLSNEPFLLDGKGVPYQVIELNGYLPGLGDVYLFTSDRQAHADPARTRAFVAASNAGWRYALAHTQELIGVILSRYSQHKTREALSYEAEKTRQLMLARSLPVGTVLPDRLRLAASGLLDIGYPGDMARLDGFVFDDAADAEPARRPPDPVTRGPSEPATRGGVALSAAQRAWLGEHPVIRYAVDPAAMPLDYLDSEGRPAGMTQDYLFRLRSLLGVRFEPVVVSDWADAMQRLARGELDLLPAVAQTPEGRSPLGFTTPYLSFPVAIFARVDAPFVGGLGALAHKRVAVVGNYAIHAWLAQDRPDLILIPVADTSAGLRAVADRQVAAFVHNLVTTSHAIGREGLVQVRMAGETHYELALGMGVRQDWQPLVEILERAIATLPGDERDAIYSRWIQVAERATVDYGPLWKSLLLTAALLLAALSHNRHLRREMAVRVRTERILADSERHYRELVESAGSSGFHLYSLAPDGTFVYASPMSEQWFGVARNTVIGCRWDDTFDLTEATRGHFAVAFAECLRGEIPAPVLLESRGPTGTRHFLSHPRPVKNDQGETVRVEGIAVNLTERLRLEEELRQAVAEARQAGQIKSDFLATMSHEIRTPLNTVLGMIHLCLESDLTARQREYLESAQRASRSLLGLLNDVLDLSKVEAGRMTLESTPFALRERLGNLTRVAAGRLSGHATRFELEIDPGVPDLLVGDALRLDQVLLNLIDNAIKFTEQGRVCVRIRILGADQTRVHLEFEVEDSGIGLSSAQLAGLFEPFRQADSSVTRRYGGSGLGLSICKRLVDLMGGSIGVESRPGVGSRFRFDAWFGGRPVAVPEAPVSSWSTPHAEPARGATDGARGDMTPGQAALLAGDALAPLMRQLAALLDAHDPLAEDFLNEHGALLAAALPPATFATLSRRIRDYRFADARDTLDHLIPGSSGSLDHPTA